MHLSEPRAAGDRRILWIAAFVVALWLSLVSAGSAFAGGDDWSSDQGHSSDHESTDWQHDTETTPPYGGDESKDEEHPPETPPQETPPEETPPTDTPPEEKPPHENPPEEKPPHEGKPPEEKPPECKPPEEKPPEEKPPVTPPPTTPPPQTTPLPETPVVPETPPKEEAPKAPVKEGGGGRGDVLPQEQVSGGGAPEAPTGAPTATPAATLPFTGSHTPWLVLAGAGFLSLGVGLRRSVAERG